MNDPRCPRSPGYDVPPRNSFSLRALVLSALAAWAFIIQSAAPAHALKPIAVAPEQERIEITTLGEIYEGRGDSLQIEAAPGADGITGRMSVRATTAGTNPNWILFALSNQTDKSIERWLTADRYTIIGSGAVPSTFDYYGTGN